MTAAPIYALDEVALRWFDELYRDVEHGWVSLFSVERQGDRQGANNIDWAPIDALDVLAATANDRADTCCVWFGVATRREQLNDRHRGGITDCDALPALWIDVDVAGPNHADNTGLPATLDEAWRLIRAFPLPATATVATGGGLQAWWFLTEPLTVEHGAGTLLDRWGITWHRIAGEHGHHIDSVFNLDRIMRLPGTWNRKHDPILVDIPEVDWQRRYGTDDLDQWLDEKPAPRPTIERPPYVGPERPGDAYNVAHSAGDVLTMLGFVLAKQWGNSDEQWTRPGKEPREGASATVYRDDGHATIWSDTCKTMWPALKLRRPYDPFGLLVATKYSGDFQRATTDLRGQGYGAPLVERVDPADLVAPPDTETPPPAAPAARLLELRALTDVAANPPTQPTELVAGLLRAGEMAAMAAPRAIGKSWFAMNLAILLGRGTGTLAGQLEIRQPTKVLYAHGELDPYSAYERWYRMCTPDGIPDGVTETFDRWRLRTINRRTTSTTDGTTSSDDHIDALLDPRLEATIDEHGIEVLIVDPWAVFYAGKENSNDETEAALDKLRDLSLRYGLAVLLVHHISAKTQPGHLAEPEDLWRGATRLADWASTRVTILRHFTDHEAEDRQLTRQEARRFADVKILRRGAPTPDFSMRMDFNTGWWRHWTDDTRITEPKLTPEGVAQACIAAGGFESVRMACAHLDEHHSTVQPLLDRCCALGLLRKAPGARGATQYLPLEDPK